MVNEKVFILFLFQSMIIIVIDVYVSLVALRLLFDCENVFVCDIEGQHPASTHGDAMHTISISFALKSWTL